MNKKLASKSLSPEVSDKLLDHNQYLDYHFIDGEWIEFYQYDYGIGRNSVRIMTSGSNRTLDFIHYQDKVDQLKIDVGELYRLVYSGVFIQNEINKFIFAIDSYDEKKLKDIKGTLLEMYRNRFNTEITTSVRSEQMDTTDESVSKICERLGSIFDV